MMMLDGRWQGPAQHWQSVVIGCRGDLCGLPASIRVGGARAGVMAEEAGRYGRACVAAGLTGRGRLNTAAASPPPSVHR